MKVGIQMIDLGITELALRMLMAVIFGGLIGCERDIKGQSAGFRTHMLVCLGAVIIALIQIQATNQIVYIATQNPEFGRIVSVEFTRLTAQIVSGIGFLGAGAIIVTKKNVSGLATAASIWATAGIGIATGLGYYKVAVIGTLTIFTVLAVIKNKLGIPGGESLTVHYLEEAVHHKILAYFREHGIRSFSTEYRIDIDPDSQQTLYSQHYTLNIPSDISIFKIIHDIGEFDAIIHVSSHESV